MSLLQKVYYFLVDTVQTLLIFAAIFLVIYAFLFRPFQVNGASMFPTFVDGEYVLTNLITLRLEDPKKDDVVVFKAPNDPEKDYIKRIIATSGDSVSLKNGDVYLNGKVLDESAYLSSEIKTYGGSFLQEGQIVTVPENQFFVLGDNRPHSSDSREWGFVKKEEIIGKSIFVYFPPNKMRIVKNPQSNP